MQRHRQSTCIVLLTTAAAASCLTTTARSDDARPNILWISAEDISPTLGCYGDEYADTPNIDAFAEQGVVFDRAFSHAGVCAVARSGIITGMYPVSIGSQHMRSRIVPPAYVQCFPEYLRAAGYYCTNNSKTDYNFDAPATAWDENGKDHDDWRGRAEGQPFFSVINLTVSHESQIRAEFDQPIHDPALAPLPPYIPDTPITRRDWARYYDIVTTMDHQTGAILDRLEADGLADNTIVFFWGDHGQGLSRGKRWVYDSGIHVPLAIRWPGVIEPSSRRDDLVCFLDFAPTVLSLAGVERPDHFHGQVIIGPEQAPPREYIFAHRDRMDETYDMIRAVRDERFKYIRNYMPERTPAQNIDYMNMMPTMQEMRRLFAAGELNAAQSLYFLFRKPEEELYDLDADPHEVHNLASDPAYAEELARLRGVLEEWQVDVGDMGLLPEPLLMEEMLPEGVRPQTSVPEIGVIQNEIGGPASIVLLCETEGASLTYRVIEGNNQGRWQLYVEPFDVAGNVTIEAKGCRLGYRDSPVHRLPLGG